MLKMDKWFLSIREYPSFISFEENTCINAWSMVHFSFGMLFSLISLTVGDWSILISFCVAFLYEVIQNSLWEIDNIWNSMFDIMFTVVGTLLGNVLLKMII
jgi:hypothetical protein